MASRRRMTKLASLTVPSDLQVVIQALGNRDHRELAGHLPACFAAHPIRHHEQRAERTHRMVAE